MTFVYYWPETGICQSFGKQRGVKHPPQVPGLAVATLLNQQDPQPGPRRSYVVDLDSVYYDEYDDLVYCKVRPVPPPLPEPAEIKALRNQELRLTDEMLMFPPDRPPVLPEHVFRWTEYRQKLRDIGKFSTSKEMIDAWPLRPGHPPSDAIADLRTHEEP